MQRLSTLLFTLVASFASAQSAPQALRIHWEPGKIYKQETFTDTSVHPNGDLKGGKFMRVTQVTDMKVSQTPPPSTDRLVHVTFASVKGEIETDGNTMTFDSTKPDEANPVLKQMFGGSVGKSFSLVYDDQDRFRDTRGLQSLATETTTTPSLTSMASSQDVANLFRKSQEMGLPAVPVNVGDTWTADETIAFPQAGEVRVQMNGRFESIIEREGRKHAKIVFDGKFGNTAARKDKPETIAEITSDSGISGILLFDLERKVVSFGAYTSSIKIRTPEQTVPFEQKVTSKILSIEDAK